MTHETLDQIKLAQHKLIAKKLQENPGGFWFTKSEAGIAALGALPDDSQGAGEANS